AESDPAVYYSADTQTKHVIYRADDGHLHELWWTPSSWTPAHRDLTQAAEAPLATGNPAAYVRAAEGTHHVLYRSNDGHLYELRWRANRLDVCRTHGFAFVAATASWRGRRPENSVQTRTQTLDVDDFGQVRTVWLENDRARSDDDLCVTTTYATP